MKIYLDTCTLSFLYKKDVDIKQAEALLSIIKNKDLEIVTSAMTKVEIDNAQNDYDRVVLNILYEMVGKVYAIPPKIPYSGRIGETPWGVPLGSSGYITDAIYVTLEPFFKDKNDVAQIYYAVKTKCDYFLTVDKKTILKPYEKNRSVFDELIKPTKIVDPLTLVVQLKKDAD